MKKNIKRICFLHNFLLYFFCFFLYFISYFYLFLEVFFGLHCHTIFINAKILQKKVLKWGSKGSRRGNVWISPFSWVGEHFLKGRWLKGGMGKQFRFQCKFYLHLGTILQLKVWKTGQIHILVTISPFSIWLLKNVLLSESASRSNQVKLQKAKKSWLNFPPVKNSNQIASNQTFITENFPTHKPIKIWWKTFSSN